MVASARCLVRERNGGESYSLVRSPLPGQDSRRGVRRSQPIRRTGDAKHAVIGHVRVNHRRSEIRVPQKLLNLANSGPRLQQMRRE